MKKCPRCELNYINDSEELCDICKKELGYTKNQDRRERIDSMFNEDFTFLNRKKSLEGQCGFVAYNAKGDEVGVVFEERDKRTPAYQHCELVFYEEYREKYGKYHRFTSFGNRVAWSILEYELLNKKSVVYHID